MEKKRAYQKPVLRKVRLEVKTSVLSTCHTSQTQQPNGVPDPLKNCALNMCFTNTHPG